MLDYSEHFFIQLMLVVNKLKSKIVISIVIYNCTIEKMNQEEESRRKRIMKKN